MVWEWGPSPTSVPAVWAVWGLGRIYRDDIRYSLASSPIPPACADGWEALEEDKEACHACVDS